MQFSSITQNNKNKPTGKLYKTTLMLSLAGALSSSLEAKVNILDALQDSTIEGFAFARYTTMHGEDAQGERYQLRFKPTILTGEQNGWRFGAGIFFSLGSSTPDNNNTDNDLQGSRGVRTDMGGSDVFNINNFYIIKSFANTKSTFKAGAMNPDAPYYDNNLDRALGLQFDSKDLSYLNIRVQFFDSWMGDDMYIRAFGYTRGGTLKSNVANTAQGSSVLPFNNSAGASVGNNMLTIGFQSSSDFTQETGFSYKLWYNYIYKLIDYMSFAELGYTKNFGNQEISFTGQVVATGYNANALYLSNALYLKDTSFRGNGNDSKFRSRNPGLFNIRFDYKNLYSGEDSSNYFSAYLGYTQNFGDGYGALIDNTGGLKLEGNLWNTMAGDESNGFGITGTGSVKNSTLKLAYVGFKVKYQKLTLGLSGTYIRNSNYNLLAKGRTDRNPDGSLRHVGNNFTQFSPTFINGYDVGIFEISPAWSYQLSPNLLFFGYYSYFVGDVHLGRIRLQAQYNF